MASEISINTGSGNAITRTNDDIPLTRSSGIHSMDNVCWNTHERMVFHLEILFEFCIFKTQRHLSEDNELQLKVNQNKVCS